MIPKSVKRFSEKIMLKRDKKNLDKKKGPATNRPLKRRGIEPYAKQPARSARAPGGWGAEESGTLARPGLRQLSSIVPGSLAVA
jgi:hypothetical protein